MPISSRIAPSLIDRVAGVQLPAACAQALSARWTAQPSIVRIRRLLVKLRLAGSAVGDEQIARAWAEAIAEALYKSLAYPAGAGPVEIVRAENRAEWLSRFI